eukprot:CAMPEP_0118939882 /NCGR_PEP_ID=MMETSP1169-20130426/30095_1 /TAXON_ID=36882 /ORGANISM="Pyramimonas obovata, Strain CCMP722" /LENGTH=243 /DNA_ID=CAMNT_0006884247 /DNA_START=1 /DNA_END=732 /DNA_ORIENTATION=+
MRAWLLLSSVTLATAGYSRLGIRGGYMRSRYQSDSWEDKSIDDLVQAYSSVFPSGNRNAASHRWATFILEKSAQLTPEKIRYFFTGFCPISGSPVTPMPRSAWRYDLPDISGVEHKGIVYHCCWPCVCDTQSYLRVDTKTLDTAEGPVTFNFLVYGDPCVDPSRIPEEAPDVSCDGDGQLEKATLSDGGHVIIGMLQPLPSGPSAVANDVDQRIEDMCRERQQEGYRSGMGTIFVTVANINPL